MTMHSGAARALSSQMQAQAGSASSYVELDRSGINKILRFLLSLNVSERRQRFALAASDEYIARYCASIDWTHHRAFACMKSSGLCALVELVGDRRTGWTRPELAFVMTEIADAQQVRAELLQIAFLAAREQGVTDLVIQYQDNECWVPALAAEFGGTIDSSSGIAVLLIGDGVVEHSQAEIATLAVQRAS